MFSLSSFKRNDITLRILPGILLLLYIGAEFRNEILTGFGLNTAEISILIAIAAYPLGILVEQFAVTIKSLLLKRTKYSENAQILKYLGYDLEEYWNKNINLYSKCNLESIIILDYYNLLRCFFLNMATITIICFIINIIANRQIFSILNGSLFILIVIFILYHFQHEHYYYYVFEKLTGNKKVLAVKKLKLLYKIPKPPKPPKFLR